MTPLQRLFILSTLAGPLLAAAAPATKAAPAAAIAAAEARGPVRLILPPAVRQRIMRSRLVDLPQSLRAVNWSVGTWENGSCTWASAMNLLRWQGRADLAHWIGQHRGGAAGAQDVVEILDQAGLGWACGREPGDEAFLEWACRTRRGATVDWENGAHAINLVGLDSQFAWLMDNTGPNGQQILRYHRADFMQHWKESGGTALTPLVGSPTPPKPWTIQTEEER